MHAVGSPTLNVRTTRFSFVTVAVPTSNTIKTTFIFFKFGRISLIAMQSLYRLFTLKMKRKILMHVHHDHEDSFEFE